MKKTILIGAARPQKLPALVCEYSIRCRTREEIRILHSWDWPAPEPQRQENRSRTGFSFVRFTLPERAGYEGAGLCLDSDMILCERIDPLFDLLKPETPLLCTANLPAVILMDCAAVRWSVESVLGWLDNGHYTYREMMDLSPWSPSRTIPDPWNSMDAFGGDTKIIHYTDMSRQPWRVVDRRPVCEMWRGELRRALADGFITRDLVLEEIEAGHVVQDVLRGL